jgi:cytochrome c oxidase subunit I
MALTETSPGDVAPEAPQEEPPPPAPSFGRGAAGNDHKPLGIAFVGVALLFLVVGGVLAVLMRAQLLGAESDLLSDQQYRTLFTFHGSYLVFLFLLPAWVGIATAVVPLQIGAARLAFPRLQSLAFWLTAVGGLLMSMAPFASGSRRITSGWALNSPIPSGPGFEGDAVELLVLGIAVVLVAVLLAVTNLLVTILKFRAPGLTSRRLPMFTWSVVVGGSVLLLCLPVLVGGLLMLYVDHHYESQLFSGFTSARGGNPLVWTRLFWFAAYPMLWALVIFALGVASEIVAVFAGRPLADRAKASAALLGVGVLAFAGWGSEVRNLRAGRYIFVVGALLVLLPVASLVLNWLLTLRKAGREEGVDAVRGRLLAMPMLHVLGLISVLAVGLGASAVSALDATGRSHSNYWQVGQQHLMYFGPATLAFVAAAHFWAPKLFGRRLSDGLGRLELLLLVGGAHLAFLPALVLGIQDMPRHTSAFEADEGWELANMAMGLGTAVLTLGVLVFVVNVLVSVGAKRGKPAGDDPWGGHTLEWTTASPPPRYNFDSLPEVRSANPALDLRGGAA